MDSTIESKPTGTAVNAVCSTLKGETIALNVTRRGKRMAAKDSMRLVVY